MIGQMQAKILTEAPIVIDVSEGSPAEKIGLQKGDLILSLNGSKVATWKDLIIQISLHPNDDVPLEFNRNNQVLKKISSTHDKHQYQTDRRLLGD